MDKQQHADFQQLEREIHSAQHPHRFRLRRRLRSVREAARAGKPFDRNLQRLQRDIEKSAGIRARRQQQLPQPEFDETLPINFCREQIAEALKTHQVLIVCGETGSGKSTQLPKICLSVGRGVDGLIGHTQPRRIAARSVADRIAAELGSPLGQHVGFKVRFTDVTRPQTYVKLMTDGILLAETQGDRFLNHYDTLIIDEAHERSLNIDFLLGYLKRLLPRRRDLKLIITSATIDAERFSAHFASDGRPAPVLEVSGRTYPVETRYRPVELAEGDADPDWQQAVLNAVDEVAEIDHGHILIFMPTEREIHETAKLLRAHHIPGDRSGQQTEILPLYARLSIAEQNRVFRPRNYRRIVIATNVAESSLTVPGIRYVIDPGTARISRYSARSQMQRLPIEPISRASADQRQGRCGREGPGICIRLYSEQDYQSRDRFTAPEIQRTNLAAVILQTMALQLGPLEDFPFLDPPRPGTVAAGYKTLSELGAIDAQRQITDIGRQLSRLPVDPRVGRMILAADQEHCLHEVLVIAAALEIRDPRERPLERQQAADEAHLRFQHEDSDFLSLLKLWDFYHTQRAALSRSRLRKACQQNFVSYNRLREWSDVYHQLLELVQAAGMTMTPRTDDYAAIHRALLTGLLTNIAQLSQNNEYEVAGGGKVLLWPGSCLAGKKPKWVVAAERIETSNRYLRNVARINPNWIEPLAGHLVQRSYSEPHWVRAQAGTMAYERVSLMGLTIVPRRRVAYRNIDPAKCRELFIQEGLVQGEFDCNAEFFVHNQRLQQEVEELLAKSRRLDVLRGDDALYDFYDHKIPADCVDGPSFHKWRSRIERRQPRFLFLSQSDLMTDARSGITDADFPDAIQIAQASYALSYSLEPGAEHDGVTLTIPAAGLGQLDAARLGWLVPGLLQEKIVAMIKALPKDLRRQLVPAPDTAREVMSRLKFGQGDFHEKVAELLSQIAGERIRPSDFRLEKLPRHLTMNVVVTDEQGEPVASSRDLAELRKDVAGAAHAHLQELADTSWHRTGLTEWSLEEFPKQVEVQQGPLRVTAYPALVDAGDSVALLLRSDATRARHETRFGLRRLFVLKHARMLKEQVVWLPQLDRVQLFASTIPGLRALRQQLMERIADRACFTQKTIPRDAAQYREWDAVGRNRVSIATQDVAALVVPLFEAYHVAHRDLEAARGSQLAPAVADMRRQLDQLMTANFLADTPWTWLLQYPRYLQAIHVRLEKLRGGNRDRDAGYQTVLQQLWSQYAARREDHDQRGIVDPELEHYRWMLEEFRVSVFAQELRTVIKVSEERLARQWEKVRAS